MVASETRFDGTQVAYGYDSGANLASIAYPDDTLRFGYDRDGLMTSAANASGAVSNVYDAATGWLDRSVGADGSAVSYLHSDGGSVTGVVSAAGTVRYTFDPGDRWTSIDSPAGTMRFTYYPWNGLVFMATTESGFTTIYSYDLMNRVTNIIWRTENGTALGGFAYVYDALGRIVSRQNSLGNVSVGRNYSYDDFDRISSDGIASYAYDAAGNRVTRTENGETVAYARGAGDRLATWTGGSYQYDLAGCVTRIMRGSDTWELTWNGQYQLVSVSTNGAFAESYAYDALGRRLSTITLEGVQFHVYDENDQCIFDVSERGEILCTYVWGDCLDDLLMVRICGKNYTVLRDIQGTVYGFVDEDERIVARFDYDSYGNVVEECCLVEGLKKIRYRFQGREWSRNTGLLFFRSRWYDPLTGQWLAKDFAGIGAGLNLYSFCDCNPVNNVDGYGCFAQAVTSALVPVIEAVGTVVATAAAAGLAVTLGKPANDAIECFNKKSDLVVKPNDPGVKGQGRELKNKSRQKKDWHDRKPNRRDRTRKKHTPGRDHKRR